MHGTVTVAVSAVAWGVMAFGGSVMNQFKTSRYAQHITAFITRGSSFLVNMRSIAMAIFCP